VPAPSTPTFDQYDMMAQLDSCGVASFDGHQGTALTPETFGNDPLGHGHVPYPRHQQSFPAAKGSFPFYSHKLPVPEVANMDVASFTDVFIQSSQAFSF